MDEVTDTQRTGDQETPESLTVSYLAFVYEGCPRSEARLIALLDGEVVVGRSSTTSGSDVTVDDGAVSKRHLTLSRARGLIEVRDLGSKNGTWINGLRLSAPAPLADGDVLRFGNTLAIARAGAIPSVEDGRDEDLPGIAPGMVLARARVAEQAPSAAPALILGDTGTGKELVARALHRRSGRAGPLCAANAGELQGTIAVSELFGRTKGAFTGALAAAGLVAAAQDGTLFLDEIGDLQLEVQPALLRLLEGGRYRPVGASVEQVSNARVVAATNVDLDAAVNAGAFRRDLLGRLRGHAEPIRLPSLARRAEDLVAWALRLGGTRALEGWNVAQVERLLLRSWPEGLRELRRVVLGGPPTPPRTWPPPDSPTTMPPPSIATAPPSTPTAPPSAPAAPAMRAPAAETPLPDRDMVVAILEATQGNVLAASRRLQIERRRLYRLLDAHGLSVEDFRAGKAK